MSQLSHIAFKVGFFFRSFHYRYIFMPRRIREIRAKDKIRVAFIVRSLAAWKTESLYRAMLSHPRFEPLLIIGQSDENDDFDLLKDYCDRHGYAYDILHHSDPQNIRESHHPDIIFYQKPYCDEFADNLDSLFCYATYSLHASTKKRACSTRLLRTCWQVYYENDKLAKFYSKRRGVNNGLPTGLPTIDELMTPSDRIPDPWPESQGKKRIIYAPHHSVNPEIWWQTATFLEHGELMLELAEKYSDKVEWVFKPHPVLRGKLEKIWGKEKTDAYYARWADAPWSSYENGEYLGLFKHSDAMIHDCGSFIEEYLATGNPVMYLIREKEVENPWNETFKKAYDLHYKGRTREDIEKFISDVIEGRDPRKEERIEFFNSNLVPPGGKSAVENIIAAILGD